MSRKSYFLLSLSSLLLTPAFAEEPAAVPVPPQIPSAVLDGEALEPEITILKREDRTIHEYRINGQLYMVKVVPQAGAPYYMVDRDGDGEFDSRHREPGDVAVPQWVIFRW